MPEISSSKDNSLHQQAVCSTVITTAQGVMDLFDLVNAVAIAGKYLSVETQGAHSEIERVSGHMGKMMEQGL